MSPDQHLPLEDYINTGQDTVGISNALFMSFVYVLTKQIVLQVVIVIL